VWNMATTKESKWVAKFIKAGNESNSEWVMREEMQQYREVLEVFGEDLLPEQVSVKLRDKQTPVLLQEKLDLTEWRPMGSFYQGVYEELQESLSSHPDNPAILKSFLDNVTLLESTKGLVLDFSGDNVVFQIDAQGRLAIKIIDYGCTKLASEEPQRLEYLHSHADKLREFI
nr:hypothetical protein [Candidatus Saccharibacteria bacterium]